MKVVVHHHAEHLHQQLQAKKFRTPFWTALRTNTSSTRAKTIVDTVTTVINQATFSAIDELKPDFRKPFTMFLDGYHYDDRRGNGHPHGYGEVSHLPCTEEIVCGSFGLQLIPLSNG